MAIRLSALIERLFYGLTRDAGKTLAPVSGGNNGPAEASTGAFGRYRRDRRDAYLPRVALAELHRRRPAAGVFCFSASPDPQRPAKPNQAIFRLPSGISPHRLNGGR